MKVAVPTENSERLVALEDKGRRLIPFGTSMTALLVALFAALCATIQSRVELEVEMLALRHQLAVLQHKAPKRLRLRRAVRKLLTILNAIMRTNTAWRDIHESPSTEPA